MITLIWMIVAIIVLWPIDQILAIWGIVVIVAKIYLATFKVVANGED